MYEGITVCQVICVCDVLSFQKPKNGLLHENKYRHGFPKMSQLEGLELVLFKQSD